MNKILLLLPGRVGLLSMAFLFAIALGAQAQSMGAYKRLVTAQGVAVVDTITGVDLGITMVSPLAAHGSVQISILQNGGNGQPYIYAVTYTPAAGFSGADTFLLELNYVNTYPYQTYQPYQVSVFPSMLEPRADYATTAYGTPVTVNVLSNDLTSSGPLTLTGLPVVDHGTATYTAAGQVTFTPAPSFAGTAHVQYTVCNAANTCSHGSLAIGVQPASPLPTDTLRLATVRNKTLTIPLSYANYAIYQAPSNGTVQLVNSNLAFRYKPNNNFTGIDQFVLVNNSVTPAALLHVRITVLFGIPPNRMAIEDRIHTPNGQPVTFNVRANDFGNLTVKSWIPPSPAMGTISGTMADGTVTFTPAANFTGVAIFYYKIGNLFVPDLETGTVHVVVSNLPPSAPVFNLTTQKNTPLVVDYAIPFGAFNFTVTDAPDHGTCTFYPGFSSQNINGQTVSGTNLLIYMPQPGYIGIDQWEADYCLNGQCQSVGAVMDVINIGTAASQNCISDCVWPGDANGDGRVDNRDVLAVGFNSGQTGPARPNASTSWYGQSAPNWNNPFRGTPYDLKHADTDGDGHIDAADTVAIAEYYQSTTTITPQIPAPDKGLPFFFELLTPSPQIGDLVQIVVHLGDPQFPVTDLQGFTLDITLSPQIVDSLLSMTYYANSWLNRDAPYLTFSKNPAPGRLESAFARVSGNSTQGFGPIGVCEFIVIDVVEGGKPHDSLPALAMVTFEASAQWGNGSLSPGQPLYVPFTLPIRTATHDRPTSDHDFLVYPSPATDHINFHLNGSDFIENLVITDLLGRVMHQAGGLHTERVQLGVSEWPAGAYVAVARTSRGLVTKRFLVGR